jgi:RNA polymerase sigma factor (sigma-70 family)
LEVSLQEWVRRAVAGDKDALGELLEQHGPQVEAALVISPTWQGALDAADVMQVTYLEVFTQIGRFDPERAESFGGWLMRMAQNNLRDAIRSLEARKSPSPRKQLDGYAGDTGMALFDVLTAGVGTPSRVARQGEAGELLHEALKCLPADYARVVQLYDIEGRDVEDVAKELGRSVGAVYMLRSRAHDRLRELLGPPSNILDSRA